MTDGPVVPSSLPERNPIKGISWMLLFTVLMTSMHTGIKHVAETGLPPFEIAFFRLLFGLLVTLPIILQTRFAVLKTERLGLLSIRAGLNVIAMLAYFTALSLSPLAEVTALGFTAPIFAVVIAMVVFRETVGLRRWSAILIGFVGTIVIVQPGVVEISYGTWLTLISALFWAMCLVIIKSLSRTESSATITAYMSILMAPIVFVPALFVWQWPTPEQWGWLVFIGLAGSAGQFAMAEAFKYAETFVVTPIDFVRLIWAALFGFLLFGEVPEIATWMGGAMILGSTAFIAYREHILTRRGAYGSRKTESG